MADKDFIAQTAQDSFQQRSESTEQVGSSTPVIGRLSLSNDIIAPWWSYARDRQLKAFWMNNEFLAGPMYNMVAKMQAIPFSIIPDDFADPEKVALANEYTEHLYDAPEYGVGWDSWFGMWVQNLLGQDNGAFSEITGKGSPEGPIIGMPGTVEMLDTNQCHRTSNPEYPVIYYDNDGRRYRLHYTRVMYDSQLPSTDIWMNKVGLCAISRAVNPGQNLLDISIYKQEKLGSRPNRAIGITQGGLDPVDVRNAMEMANLEMTTKGLRRYSQLIVLGSATLAEADMKLMDIASLPDGFSEQDSIVIGMAIIALAFGVDARELFPAMGVGATRADALLQHIKQRGKGPGQILQSVERLFSRKFLPPFLRMEFDYQDDVQDRQEAEIEKIRAERRQRDLGTGVTDMRTERERMLAWGEIDESQFARLELTDGRLPDGTSILSLFFSNNEMIGTMLSNRFENILDKNNNDPMEIFQYINERRAAISISLANSRSLKKVEAARQAIAALGELENEYIQGETVEDKPFLPEQRMFPTRREDLTTPNQTEELGGNDVVEIDSDDDPLVKGGGKDDDFFMKTIEEYRLGIRGAIRALWNGQDDVFEFESKLNSQIRRQIPLAFAEGAKQCGVLPSEFTEAENEWIDAHIADQISYVEKLGDAVEAGSKANGGKLSAFDWRVDLWVMGYETAKTQGQVMACGDKKQKWILHADESCDDCKRLDGKVKRGSFWLASGILPRSLNLDCMQSANGVPVCKCELVETDEPVSRGPLPRI